MTHVSEPGTTTCPAHKQTWRGGLGRRVSRALHSRPVLLVAFAFAVMADPVSSVAYALFGAAVVTFTLVINLGRGAPIFSLLASLLIAAGLYIAWARAGRPRGIASSTARAEA